MASFDTLERSVQDSAPIEVYDFIVGLTTYRWTSSEDSVTVGVNTYDPIAISRGSIISDPSDRRQPLAITVPGDNDLTVLFINQAPAAKVTCTVTRLQRNESPTFSTKSVIYKGVVASVSFSDDGTTAEINVQTYDGPNTATMPKFSFLGQCNNNLYDSDCTVNPASFTTTGTASASSGNTVTVPGLNAHPDGYFNGGIAVAGGGTDKRLVLSHAGNVLTLLLPFVADPTGSSVSALAGCNHLVTGDCATKFDNVLNFAGFAWIPNLNPFSTNPWATQ